MTKRNELRLYAMHTYSDDPTATCLGVQGVLNWLASWRTVNLLFNMMPAIVDKRNIGTQIKWLGALPNPHLGYLTIPNDKLLRVQAMIEQVLVGNAPKSSYRSLMGFLEWFAWCFAQPRSRMWGLYAPLRGMDDGSAVLVEPTPRIVEQLGRWKADLWKVAGVAIEAALPRRRRQLPSSSATFFVSMDAAKEGTVTPGIAGWCHGWTWAWFYPKSWLQLPIAVHEFLAFAVSVIQFSPMLVEAPRIVFETDSISAAFILEKENAKSPLMQVAFQLLLATQEWVALITDAGELERSARHVKGKINIFADAESRGYRELVSDLCMQLGIKRKHMQLTGASRAYLEAFAAEASPLVPLPLLGLDTSPACTMHDGPTAHPLWVHDDMVAMILGKLGDTSYPKYRACYLVNRFFYSILVSLGPVMIAFRMTSPRDCTVPAPRLVLRLRRVGLWMPPVADQAARVIFRYTEGWIWNLAYGWRGSLRFRHYNCLMRGFLSGVKYLVPLNTTPFLPYGFRPKEIKLDGFSLCDDAPSCRSRYL